MGRSTMLSLIAVFVLMVVALSLAFKDLGLMGLLGLVPIGVLVNNRIVRQSRRR